MSVLGKRKRPADINADVPSPKRMNKDIPKYGYISSDNEDDDLKSGEPNQLIKSTPPQSTNYEDYYSIHKGYDPKQKWKLFFADDYGVYKYGIEDKRCVLDKFEFYL